MKWPYSEIRSLSCSQVFPLISYVPDNNVVCFLSHICMFAFAFPKKMCIYHQALLKILINA
jgi:hypothetical protein